jgi:hypothetical protein
VPHPPKNNILFENKEIEMKEIIAWAVLIFLTLLGLEQGMALQPESEEKAVWREPHILATQEFDTTCSSLPRWYVERSGLIPQGRWPDSLMITISVDPETGDTVALRVQDWESRLRGITLFVKER